MGDKRSRTDRQRQPADAGPPAARRAGSGSDALPSDAPSTRRRTLRRPSRWRRQRQPDASDLRPRSGVERSQNMLYARPTHGSYGRVRTRTTAGRPHEEVQLPCRLTPEEIEARRFRLPHNGYDCEGRSIDSLPSITAGAAAQPVRRPTAADVAADDIRSCRARRSPPSCGPARRQRPARSGAEAEAARPPRAALAGAEVEADDLRPSRGRGSAPRRRPDRPWPRPRSRPSSWLRRGRAPPPSRSSLAERGRPPGDAASAAPPAEPAET